MNLPHSQTIISQFHLQTVVKNCLVGAIEASQGNMVKASILLGIPRATLYRIVKRYDINLMEIRHKQRMKLAGDSKLG